MPTISLHPEVSTFLQRSPHGLLIEGRRTPAISGKTFESENPSDGSTLAELAAAGPEDVDRAVDAARQAFESGWAQMSPRARERLLRRWAELIEAHADELAQLESLDNGKPVRQTLQVDSRVAANLAYHFAGWPSKIAGYTAPVSVPDHLVYTLRQPLGIAAIIIPWNFPLIHSVQKIAPALACGNTVILKPSQLASLAPLRLAELALEAGIPPGVLNVLTGSGSVAGRALAEHPGVNKIQFTGSTAVGRSVVQASAGNLKRLALELGSKAPNIIFADADLDAALPGVFHAAFDNSGQSCVAGARLFVHQSVYEQVLEGLVAFIGRARIGHALDPGTDLGPLVAENQLLRVQDYIRRGLESGARLVCGGRRLQEGACAQGYY
ncbi:MAG: aldehyde dehydrogenase family protein, partial [Chloroflexi bacterium]